MSDPRLLLSPRGQQWCAQGGVSARGQFVRGASQVRFCAIFLCKMLRDHVCFRFASSFCRVWKNDENILLLLSAIALFTPDRANVVHHNVIKKVQVCIMQLNTNHNTYFTGWILLLAPEIFTDQVCGVSSSGNISDTNREATGAPSPQWCPHQGELSILIETTK